jgi:hypothetical protein
MPTDCNKGIVSSVEVPIPTDECACIGVKTITWNVNNTVTITLTDNSSITSPVLRGPQGLPGVAGVNGTNGTDGVGVEMNFDTITNTIQWRPIGHPSWINLYTFPANETWKTIRGTTPSDPLIDGTIINGYIAGSGASAMSYFYIRKRGDGYVEINLEGLDLTKNALDIPLVVLPVAYRPVYTTIIPVSYIDASVYKTCSLYIQDNGLMGVSSYLPTLFPVTEILVGGYANYSTN